MIDYHLLSMFVAVFLMVTVVLTIAGVILSLEKVLAPWWLALAIPAIAIILVGFKWLDTAQKEWATTAVTVEVPIRASDSGYSFCLVGGHKIYLGDLGNVKGATAKIWYVPAGSALGISFVAYYEFVGLKEVVEAKP